MLRTLTLALACCCLPFLTLANDYEKAWDALKKNDRTTARSFFQKALQDPQTATDARLSLLLLDTFDGHEEADGSFRKQVYATLPDPGPYLYSFWFNGHVLGAYGKKTNTHQLALLDDMIANRQINGSLRASGHYVKALHYFYANQFDKARQEYNACKSVNQWQFVGPFDNISGSGFNKSDEVLRQPVSSKGFLSATNSMVNWFVPAHVAEQSWTTPHFYFQHNNAVLFGQSFVQSDAEKDVILNAGFAGSIKVWLNDELILADPRERVTELDCYKRSVHLHKGYNRLLVQIGYTETATPNYIIRFTDEQQDDVSGLTYTSQPQAYTAAKAGTHREIPHFAEQFFEEKIRREPDNLLNYLLLSQTYRRNSKLTEARKLMSAALEKAPDNSLLRFEWLQVLQKDQSSTLLSQEVERFKDKDPDCLISLMFLADKQKSEEKYDESMRSLDRISNLYGEDESILDNRISILGSQKKFDELVKLAESCYKKYPENLRFVNIMYNLNKEGYKNNKAALEVLEKFNKNNFNYDLLRLLSTEYISQGMKDKGQRVLQDLGKRLPYNPEVTVERVRYAYDQQDYKTSLALCEEILRVAPYVSGYWENLGTVQEQLKNKEAAIAAFEKALYYDKNKFSARARIRSLQGQKDVFSLFPETDYYQLIKNAPEGRHKEFAFYYLLDEKQKVVYADGASEQYLTFVVKINNEKGIDSWKETTLGYNGNNQTLLIEKAEVVKKNGSKTPAEKNGNELVFTSLEAGDAVVIRYKLQDYMYGKLSDKFWDKYGFSSTSPSEISRYLLLVSDKQPFRHKMMHSDLQPTQQKIDDFTLYTWQIDSLPVVKSEPLMPPMGDIGQTLHLSSIHNWKEMADWYTDLVTKAMQEQYEVRELYQQLFPQGNTGTDSARAATIYNYIASNIRYSSVSFRQGAYIPQKPSVTINTRLGDCKDLSALFVALAKIASIKANMVLVDTRNNGREDMVLPSLEFNHCIVRCHYNGRDRYLELTDNNLPMGALPYNLYNALSLLIPENGETLPDYDLRPLPVEYKMRDRLKTDIVVKVDGNHLKVSNTTTRFGSLTSGFRNDYALLSEDKQRESMESMLAGKFRNGVTLDSLQIPAMEQLCDSVRYKYAFTARNEVMEAGNMLMLRLPFTDAIFTMDQFSLAKRQFPIEYWSYEDADEYESTITVILPAGKTFTDLPANQQLRFGSIRYSLTYTKLAPNKLQVKRKATMGKANIEAADYPAFREMVEKGVQAESKFIVFK